MMCFQVCCWLYRSQWLQLTVGWVLTRKPVWLVSEPPAFPLFISYSCLLANVSLGKRQGLCSWKKILGPAAVSFAGFSLVNELTLRKSVSQTDSFYILSLDMDLFSALFTVHPGLFFSSFNRLNFLLCQLFLCSFLCVCGGGSDTDNYVLFFLLHTVDDPELVCSSLHRKSLDYFSILCTGDDPCNKTASQTFSLSTTLQMGLCIITVKRNQSIATQNYTTLHISTLNLKGNDSLNIYDGNHSLTANKVVTMTGMRGMCTVWC